MRTVQLIGAMVLGFVLGVAVPGLATEFIDANGVRRTPSYDLPMPIDGPIVTTLRHNQTSCAATATQLESLACTSSLIINRKADSTETCFIGGSSVTVANGLELAGSSGMKERVSNANVFYCISASDNCDVTYYCGD